MAYEQILYEVADQILTITLNRPEKLNAFTGTMMNEMIDAFDRADKDDDVRAIIVTGAGRAFCAGADLSSGGDTFDRAARGRTAPMPDRRRSRLERRAGARRRRPRHAADLRMPEAGDRRGQRPRGRHRRHHAARRWTSASRPRPRASASCSPAAASCRKRRRAGSCRASSASRQALEWCYSGRVFDAGGARRPARQQGRAAGPAAAARARDRARRSSTTPRRSRSR